MTSSSPPADTTKPTTTTTTTRLPSLNALAARISSSKEGQGGGGGSNSGGMTTLAPRPRLVASALRTSSTTSLSTVASAADSMVVNPPSTRSTSRSATPSNDGSAHGAHGGAHGGGEGLTTENLEKHNHEDAAAAAIAGATGGGVEKNLKAAPVGYKNIPSLDAITARLAKARALSVDGSAKPPEPEMIEDPKTPGVPMKAPEHPLQFPWTIYHDSKARVPYTPGSGGGGGGGESANGPYSSGPVETGAYEAGLTVIGEFDTVESFCRYFNWLKPPSKLEKNSNYHLFKSGIKPMWEDAANAGGGRWVLTMKNSPGLLDRCWSWLAMALVGEELEEGDEICGAVVSLRSKVDRIQLWTRSREDVERLNGIGRKLVKLLDVSEADGIGLEFQYNTEDRPLLNKFLSIQAVPTTSYRSQFGPTHTHTHTHTHHKSLSGSSMTSQEGGSGSQPLSAGAAPSGGFGNFGLQPGWRGKRV